MTSNNPPKFPSTMKPKYLPQPKKHPLPFAHNTTTPTTSKILLTDLCPQQKAKIGQLIKTLEQRKKQNQQLAQQLQVWKSNYIGVDRARQELEGKLGERERDVERLEGEVERLEREVVEKGVEVERGRLERQRWEEKRRARVSVGTSMEAMMGEMTDQGTQTKEKKKKLKEKEVQVNTINQLGGIEQRQTKKNNFYQPNSKSFDRIMKGDRLAVSNYQTAVFREGDRERDREQEEIDNDEENRLHIGGASRNYVALSSNRHPSSNADPFTHDNIPKLRASQLQDPYHPQHQQSSPPTNKNWSQYQESSYRQNPNPLKLTQEQIQVEDTENDDDEFQMLARKWMQLKERNIRQLARGDNNLDGGDDNEESEINVLNNGNNGNNTLNHYMRSDELIRSLGLQSQSKESIRVKGVSGNNDRNTNNKNNRNPIHEEEQDSGLVDEEMLNRALKGRDFSASRLLNNSRSKRNTEEESGEKGQGDRRGRDRGEASSNNKSKGHRQDEGKSTNSNNNNTHNNKTSSKPSLVIRQQDTTNTNNPSQFGASKTRNPITQSHPHDNNTKQKMDFYSPDLLDLVEEMNR